MYVEDVCICYHKRQNKVTVVYPCDIIFKQQRFPKLKISQCREAKKNVIAIIENS